jgi:hypothetical protein
MITLPKKDRGVFPEQAGLIPLLEKCVSEDGLLLDPYYSGQQCRIGLYYGGDQIKADCVIITFRDGPKPECNKHYFIHHPIRSNMSKWNYSQWSGKKIKWSTIVANDLVFEQYKFHIVERDVSNDLLDFRLALHSLERQIPVLSEDGFCQVYYRDFNCETTRPSDVRVAFEKLRQPQRRLTQDHFVHNLINIVGRTHAN